jgi:hypothetical protein
MKAEKHNRAVRASMIHVKLMVTSLYTQIIEQAQGWYIASSHLSKSANEKYRETLRQMSLQKACKINTAVVLECRVQYEQAERFSGRRALTRTFR